MRIDFTPRRLMEPSPEDMKKLSDQALSNIADLEEGLQDVYNQISDVGINLSRSITDKLVVSISKVSQLSESLKTSKDLSKDINNIQEELNKNLLKEDQLNISRAIAQKKLDEALRLNNAAAERKARRTLEELDAELQINNSVGDQLKKLLEVAETEDKRLKSETKITEETKKQNEFINSILKKVKEKLDKYLGISAIFKTIIDSAHRYNSISVDIGKNTGYGADQANKITDSLVETAQNSENINVTLKSAGEAMAQIGDATGLYGKLSADALETQVMLTKQLGLSGEEAAGVYKYSLLTGKESSKINDEMLGAFVNTRNQYKVGVSLKGVFAEASKVSGRLAANLQNNPVAITKAIIQAKAFGTSLEQIAKQGDALLDFESSLENELKAELLTGKQLNLERARAAALSGDQVTLAEELNKNVGTLDDFQKMNVLQQKSLAAAMGLSVDELADQLRKQKMAQEQGKSLEQITKEEAEQAEKRQKIQEKFNAAIEKLQDLIGNIVAGPLGKLLEMFTNVLGLLTGTTGQVVAFGAILLYAAGNVGKIASGFKGMLNTTKGLGENIKNLFSKEGRASLFGGGADKVKEVTEGADTATSKTKGGGVGGFLKGIDMAQVLKGAAAILILSAALFVAAKAFQEFAKVEWESIAKGGVALLGLAGIAMLLGNATAGIIKGAIAIAILGAALIPLGYALNLAAPGIEAFGKAIKSAFEGIATIITAAAAGISTIFNSLQNVDVVKLLAIGPALIGIGFGLASLGAGSVINAIGTFLGGDPIKKIERLAAAGDGLQKTATALQALAGALLGISSALNAIDTSKLESLDKFASNRETSSVIGGITDFITAPIKAIGNVIGGGKEGATGIDLTPMIAAINEVKAAVNELQKRPVTINMDGKQIGSSLVQGSYKLA